MLLFFSNLKPRNPPRDFRGLYFNLKTLCFEKCQIKLNYFFGKPPGGLLSLILEKSNISAFICIEKIFEWNSCPQTFENLRFQDNKRRARWKIYSSKWAEKWNLPGGLSSLEKICLGGIAKEAFPSGQSSVATTFHCEQVTNDVTSFGLLLSQKK